MGDRGDHWELSGVNTSAGSVVSNRWRVVDYWRSDLTELTFECSGKGEGNVTCSVPIGQHC